MSCDRDWHDFCTSLGGGLDLDAVMQAGRARAQRGQPDVDALTAERQTAALFDSMRQAGRRVPLHTGRFVTLADGRTVQLPSAAASTQGYAAAARALAQAGHLTVPPAGVRELARRVTKRIDLTGLASGRRAADGHDLTVLQHAARGILTAPDADGRLRPSAQRLLAAGAQIDPAHATRFARALVLTASESQDRADAQAQAAHAARRNRLPPIPPFVAQIAAGGDPTALRPGDTWHLLTLADLVRAAGGDDLRQTAEALRQTTQAPDPDAVRAFCTALSAAMEDPPHA